MKVTHLITISVLFLSLILLSPPTIAPDTGFHKVWNEETQTISIISPTNVTQMTIRLISSEPDLCTFTEIFEITNFKAFTPAKDKDFKAQTVKHKGNKSVTLVEWFIEQNVAYTVNITDYKVVQVEKEIYNNKTGKNEVVMVNESVISGYHNETRYKNEWGDYEPHGKPMAKDAVQRIKVVYHKPPEIGDVRIQTIPIFRGVKCDELTWWNTSWSLRKEVILTSTTSFNNPIEDGYIKKDGAVYTRDNNGNDLIMMVDEGSEIYRTYIEWDISTLPSDAIISNVKLLYHGSTQDADAHIHEMLGARPSISTDINVYNEAGEGTIYADVVGFPEVGNNKEIALDSNAISDLESSITNGWFAIGIQLDTEILNTDSIYSEDYATADPKPTLYIEYSSEGGLSPGILRLLILEMLSFIINNRISYYIVRK